MSNLDATTLRDYIPLDPARIEAAQAHAAIGGRVTYAAAMPSTMQPAHGAVASAACHGLVVLTEEQTAGRGRRGRGWHAPPGRGLLMSVVLMGDDLAAQLPYLAMLAGLAVQQAVVEALAEGLTDGLPDAAQKDTRENDAAQIRLKWPNDLVWCSPDAPTSVRKLGGILVESVYRTAAPKHAAPGHAAPYAVLGMGINVNQTMAELPPVTAPALPPSSLRLACGHPLDRTALAIGICRALEAAQARLGAATPAAVAALVAAWQARLALMHQPIQVYPVQGAPFAATAHAVTAHGELLVVDDQGTSHTLLADEVSIRPQAGSATTMDEF
ncbi:MAG: biotin--[acetyl-CoA-carboxylase] ligase [Litorilinea sp.]